MTAILKNPTLQKAFDFFRPLPGETRCLGLSLGRQGAGVVEGVETGTKTRILNVHSFPFSSPLWTGVPGGESLKALVLGLKPFLQKKENYQTLQVSLPDPAAQWEVFELEKLPLPGAPMTEFLNWRFKPTSGEAPLLSFTTQVLGDEKGKKLLLATALDQAWLEAVQKALEEAGARASFLDLASRYRFNLFHESLAAQGSGALISLEKEYWTLLIWDSQGRPRFQRSKWWREPVQGPKDLPLDQMALEVERTIRSYVHSGQDRSVENLFLLVPQAWQETALLAFQKPTEGRVTGLSLEPSFEFSTPPEASLSPSMAAAAVRQ